MAHDEQTLMLILLMAGGFLLLTRQHSDNVSQAVVHQDPQIAPWYMTFNVPQASTLDLGLSPLPQLTSGISGGSAAPCSTCAQFNAGYSNQY